MDPEKSISLKTDSESETSNEETPKVQLSPEMNQMYDSKSSQVRDTIENKTNDDEPSSFDSFEIVTPQEILESLPSQDEEFLKDPATSQDEANENSKTRELAKEFKEKERKQFDEEIRRIKAQNGQKDDHENEGNY